MAGCGGGKMIPKYKDGGVVRAQYGSTKSESPLDSALRKREAIQTSPTPMPDNFTPAERDALAEYERKQAAEQAAREQRYKEMDKNMQRGMEAYEKSRREGRQ